MKAQGLEGMVDGAYYYEIPKHPVNDWLVREHQKKFNEPPDFFTCGGFAAAMAVVAAIQKAGGTDPEKLIAAMEGMEFQTPKRQDGLPQGGPPGDAEHVRVQDDCQARRAVADPDADPGADTAGDRAPDHEQALGSDPVSPACEEGARLQRPVIGSWVERCLPGGRCVPVQGGVF